MTGLPADVDDVRCSEGSRVTRCVVSFAREQNAVAQTKTRKATNRVDVATIANREQDATDAVAHSPFASVVDGSDEIRPDVMSECGSVEGDVRKRRGNDRIVARGLQANENPDEAAEQRTRSIAETEGDCPIRTKTFQEMTAKKVATQPEIDQHPVEEDEEEDGGEVNESSGIHRIDEYSRSSEANRLNRSVTSAGDSFESPPFVNHLKFHVRANSENESLESSSFSNHLNRHAVNQNAESSRQSHHPLNHSHRYDVNPGCESAPGLPPLAHNTNPDDIEDIDLLDLVNESPPSYEDALHMRRFVLPLTTGSGQHFRNQTTSVDEIDEDSIGSPGHLSPDYGDNPSRSRAAVVIQVMETSL